MANQFVTPQAVARDAAVALVMRSPTLNYVSRRVEAPFANKVGDTVKVKVSPAIDEASEFSGTTVASDITVRSVDVELQHHFYVRHDLSSTEMKLELDDFTADVVLPAIGSISTSIDKYLVRKLSGGFRRNVSGTITDRLAVVDDVLAGQKVLNDGYIPREGRVGLIDTTAEASLLALEQFTSRNYAAEGVLPRLSIGQRLGATWVPNPNLGTFARGDVAGTVLATGTEGNSTVALADFTAATGTIYEGTALVIAGDTQRFVVTADTAIVGNDIAVLPIYPALPHSPTDAAVTFEAAGYENILYHPNAVACAVIAPAPIAGTDSSTYTMENVSVRVSMDGSVSSLSNSVVFDVFVGAKVVQPAAGVIVGS